MAALSAGTASSIINPPPGVELAGYPHEPRRNTGVHDDLMVSCLYLTDGSAALVLASYDLCYFSKAIADDIREAAASACGLAKANIILSCSHTHSAPWTAARLDYESIVNSLDYDHDYVDSVKAATIAVIQAAMAGIFPAEAGLAFGRCGKEQGVGGNRRDPAGEADDQVPVLAVRDLTGKIRSLVVKYAVHPTMLHAENLLASADYVGYLRSYLQEKHPDCTVLFQQGTSGDQSPRYFRTGQTFAEAGRMGAAIGREAERTLGTMVFRRDIRLAVKADQLIPILKKLPDLRAAEQQVAVEKAKYEAMRTGNAGYTALRTQELAVFGAENAYGYALQQDKLGYVPFAQNELPIELTAVAIGEARMVFMPGEMFVSFGLLIKKAAGSGTWVVTLSNGFLPGYCCDRKAYEEGGYEAGTSMLQPETGDLIVGAALRLLQELE